MEFLKQNLSETVLSLLILLYLLVGHTMPGWLAEWLSSTMGHLVVIVIALVMFAKSKPMLGGLILLAAYVLIRNASVKSGIAALQDYYPTEAKKWTPFSPMHQFPYTLEEEIVKVMTNEKFNTEYVKTPFKPVLDDTHDAAML